MSQILLFLFRKKKKKSSLQLAALQPEGIIMVVLSDPVCTTRSFQLCLFQWVRQVHIIEQNKRYICWYSFLCVSLELPWHQHKNTTMSSRFDSDRSACPFFTYFFPFSCQFLSLEFIHTFLCKAVPSLLHQDPSCSFLPLFRYYKTRIMCLLRK